MKACFRYHHNEVFNMKEREDIANQSGERQVSIGVVEHVQSKLPLIVKYLPLNCQILVVKLSNTHLIVKYLSLNCQILTSLSITCH